MRILVLSNEVWNDKINGNNVTTNWFEGMNAEFANIYASPGTPDNNCCNKYYQITDKMMLNSIIKRKKAGKVIVQSGIDSNDTTAESEPKKLYEFLKSISGNILRFIRELLWLFGKYDELSLREFVDDFQPDVIFSERMATCKMLRLEKKIHGITNAPFFAFTGDDEYSLKQFSFSPSFWINRFMTRKRLRNNVRFYKVYYTLSYEQKEYYEKIFGCKCKILQKCGEFDSDYVEHKVKEPIKLIYAGKFYCNRWKVLAQISETLKKINDSGKKAILEIYTKDKPTKKQKKLLNDGINSFIKGPVSQEELRKIYHESDIALHVESSDLKNRLATRFSFSTKIIDCIFSGCAVLAFCWEQHSGLTYLKREDAALCVSSKEELYAVLSKICENPQIICDYSYKAYVCGKQNHDKKQVQKMLLDDFESEV